MNLLVFNASLLVGWALVLVGGCMLNLGAGLIGGGVLLLLIVLLCARMGGVYAPRKAEG